MIRLRNIEGRVRRQEDEHIAEVQAERKEAAERAEREHREELDRQAAMTDIPEEQVALQPEQEAAQLPPLIGENRENGVQVVSSSATASSTSTGATSRLERQERQEEEAYWENILEI
eukprot:5494933-Amphidinium_carterae.1